MEHTKMTGHPKQNIEINPAIAGIKYAMRDIVLPAKELEKAGKKEFHLKENTLKCSVFQINKFPNGNYRTLKI